MLCFSIILKKELLTYFFVQTLAFHSLVCSHRWDQLVNLSLCMCAGGSIAYLLWTYSREVVRYMDYLILPLKLIF